MRCTLGCHKEDDYRQRNEHRNNSSNGTGTLDYWKLDQRCASMFGAVTQDMYEKALMFKEIMKILFRCLQDVIAKVFLNKDNLEFRRARGQFLLSAD